MAAAKQNELAPVTNDDEIIRKALKEAHIPSLMAALVHITGDHRTSSAARSVRRTRSSATRRAASPKRSRRQIRGIALRRVAQVSRRRTQAAAGAERARSRDGELRHRHRSRPRLRRVPDRRTGDGRRRSVRRAGIAERSGVGAREVQGADRRFRHVGPARRHSAAGSGHSVRDPRTPRERRRHLVPEHLSGLPGRQPEPHVLLQLPAERLAAVLFEAGSAAAVLRQDRRRLRAAQAHPLQHRSEDVRVRRRESVVARHRRARTASRKR